MTTRYITTVAALQTGLTAILTHSDSFADRLARQGPHAMAEHVADMLTLHLSVHSDTTRIGEPAVTPFSASSQKQPDLFANFFKG